MNSSLEDRNILNGAEVYESVNAADMPPQKGSQPVHVRWLDQSAILPPESLYTVVEPKHDYSVGAAEGINTPYGFVIDYGYGDFPEGDPRPDGKWPLLFRLRSITEVDAWIEALIQVRRSMLIDLMEFDDDD